MSPIWPRSAASTTAPTSREPGCAVLAAIAAGELSADRLESYRKLLGEAAFAARKNDHRLAKEAQKLGKQRILEGRKKERP